MKVRLSILAFLFSLGCTAQTGVLGPITSPPPGGLVNPWTDELVEGGAFAPSTSATAAVTAYKNFDYGWLICYGMNSYAGYYWGQQGSATYNPLPASTWDNPQVNVRAWADSAQAHGVQYAVLTVVNEFGFCLFPSQADYNMSPTTLSTGQQSPYRPYPYSVAANPGNDQTIVDSFVYLMRERGIEPIPYVCLFTELNLADGATTNLSGTRLAEFENYYSRVLQELVVKYDFNYVWLDYAGAMPAGTCQKFYNAVKSIDPTVAVVGNAIGETDFAKYPYDLASIEEYAVYGGNTSYQLTTQAHGGTTYYCPREIVATPYGTHSQWYDYDTEVLLDPPYPLLVKQTVGEFQGIVDAARAYACPFLAAMLVTRDGRLLQDNLDFLRQIDFLDD
jgi:hypothetical protein